MTKRAGQAQRRRAKREAAAKAIMPHGTIATDNLKKSESLNMEIRSVAEGWLIGPQHRPRLDAVVHKLLTVAEHTEDTNVMLRIFNAIAQADYRFGKLSLESQRKEMPTIIVNNGPVEQAPSQKFLADASPEVAQQYLAWRKAQASLVVEGQAREIEKAAE